MNYIELINTFWRFYDENKDKLNTSDIVLYKVILRYCNKIGWINPFTVNPFLMSEINPLAPNTYYKSLKKLDALELISWEKGRYNVKNQKITILKIKTSIDTSINTSIDTSIKTSIDTSIDSNNKTIKLLNYNTIKQYKESDFDFLLNCNEFKNYLENKNLKITKKEKGKTVFNFKKELINLGIDKKIVDDWLLVRKTKKATNTETAFNAIKKEIELCELSANECIKTSVERNWSGFKSKWIDNLKEKSGEKRKQKVYDVNPEIRKNPNRMQF